MHARHLPPRCQLATRELGNKGPARFTSRIQQKTVLHAPHAPMHASPYPQLHFISLSKSVPTAVQTAVFQSSPCASLPLPLPLDKFINLVAASAAATTSADRSIIYLQAPREREGVRRSRIDGARQKRFRAAARASARGDYWAPCLLRRRARCWPPVRRRRRGTYPAYAVRSYLLLSVNQTS